MSTGMAIAVLCVGLFVAGCIWLAAILAHWVWLTFRDTIATVRISRQIRRNRRG